MWVGAESEDDLKNGVKFQLYTNNNDLMYEGIFVDENLYWRVTRVGSGSMAIGDLSPKYNWIDLSCYKIWKENMWRPEAVYLNKVFNVAVREWDEDRLCSTGVSFFLREVVCKAVENNWSIDTIKEHIKTFLQYNYSLTEYRDLLEELDVVLKESKVTMTFTLPAGVSIEKTSPVDWLYENYDEYSNMQVEVVDVD